MVLGWRCIGCYYGDNPVQLCTMCLAILSVFVDPTTAGIGDSKTALGYDKPNREE